MTPELAEQIALMAAPIYAALLMRKADAEVSFVILRKEAVMQAHALWLATLEHNG